VVCYLYDESSHLVSILITTVSLGICIWKHPTYIFSLLDFYLSLFATGPNKQTASSVHLEVVTITVQRKVKYDHRSKFSNLSNWKEEA